jgi:predicted NAD-dependent protein-ADP-ribosyltransferase YbiA (DUF1768 family)
MNYLSNFEPFNVKLFFFNFPSVEHGFQAMKYLVSGHIKYALEFETDKKYGLLPAKKMELEGGKKGFNRRKVNLDITAWEREKNFIMKELINSRYTEDKRFREIIQQIKIKPSKLIQLKKIDRNQYNFKEKNMLSKLIKNAEVIKSHTLLFDLYNLFFPVRQFRVAIIVPFRDLHSAQKRQQHLNRFVPNMTKFLLKLSSKITHFHIFIIEQSKDNRKFNRGKLLNIGFKIAGGDFDSYIFHDVDLLPKPGLSEWYTKSPIMPLHLAKCWNRYNNHPNYFGGIVSFNKQQFEEINGFPNIYWGWGGEDDELYLRVQNKNLKILSPSKHLNAIEDMEKMSLTKKMNILKKNKWKCMVKWETTDEHNKYRKLKNKPLWWGLTGTNYKLLSVSKLSDFCTKYTVDVLKNNHWTDDKSFIN